MIRFRPDVPIERQNAIMAANGMHFGRPIYGTRTFVAKVASGSALTIANALRDNPLLEIAGVNAVMRAYYDPNDPRAPEQGHLASNQINARAGWDYGHGLGALSLIAILDSGIDAGDDENNPVPHPDFAQKFISKNWVTFSDNNRTKDSTGHGTVVGGLACASTDNREGIAGTGFSAFPMSVKVLFGDESCNPTMAPLSNIASGIYWAAGHGASVINMSFGCPRQLSLFGCSPEDPKSGIYELKSAVDKAYERGITLVAAAGDADQVLSDIRYPAAFGQLMEDVQYGWAYNTALVLAVTGTWQDGVAPGTVRGDHLDFAAPQAESESLDTGLLSSIPAEDDYWKQLCWSNYIGEKYGRANGYGTSVAAPQVAGLASLLTTLGYLNYKVSGLIKDGATDLPPTGYDPDTGWGRINMGRSMQLAHRPLGRPDMVVVPNTGRKQIQQFNFQGSGFTPDLPHGGLTICYTRPGPSTICISGYTDHYGVAGVGLITISTSPPGTWSAYMYETNDPSHATSTVTFTVDP